MMVAAELGFEFLWVDRYCVPQGANDAEDRHRKIKQMDQIYLGAELTIVAATGKGSDSGLPGIKGIPRKSQRHGCFGKHTIVSTMTSPRVLIHGTPWYSRAWTYQEAICSRRRLFFTDEQVFFECQEMSCRESVVYMWPLNEYHILDEANIATIEGGFKSVIDHITQYTKRQLTYDSDALNAILGVLQLYSTMKVPVFHFWGVPMAPQYSRPQEDSLDSSSCLQNTFVRSLCWVPKEKGHRRSGFPTWPWAGWSCSVNFEFRIIIEDRPICFDERITATVSIGRTNGHFIPLEDTFHQDIKLNKLHHLSKTLRIRGNVVKLRAKIVMVRYPGRPALGHSPLLFAWPLHQDEIYGDVQFIIPIQLLQSLDEQAVSLWTEHPPPLLGILMQRRISVLHRVFVLVVAEVQKGKYERVGHLELDSGFASGSTYDQGPQSVSTGQRHDLDFEDYVLRRKQWETESEICDIDLI